MLRTLIGAAFAAAWITIIPGCTTPSRSGGLLSQLTAPASRDEEDSSEESRTSRVAEPARTDSQPDASVASYTEPGARQPGDPAAQYQYSAAQTQQRPLDAATLYLIESELRDLPAAERERWVAYLKTVDPQTIPYVLQARRMEANVAGGVQPQQPNSTGQPSPGMRQPYVASGNQWQPQIGAGGAMSQMRLDAPDPVGAPVATTRHTRPPAQPAASSVDYTYNDDGMRVTQVSHNMQGPLPRISPATSDRTQQPQMSDGMIATSDYETALGPQGEPASSGQDAYLQEALQRVIALTEAEVAAKNPGYSEDERMDYVRSHVALRMLYFMSDQPQLAQQAIPDLGPEEQEFWTEMFWSLSDYFDAATTPNSGERAALAVAQLRSAARHLEEQAQLELWNTSFCHKITSFGNFDRYERDEFHAGQRVGVYAELRNFHSEPTTNGYFRTRLKSHIEIRRGGVDGERVDYNTFPPTEDLCRAPRNDYYHSYQIDLPNHLTPGPYALVLTVEDTLSGKVATDVLDFVIR